MTRTRILFVFGASDRAREVRGLITVARFFSRVWRELATSRASQFMAAFALQELNALNFPDSVAKKRTEAAKRQREQWAAIEKEKQLERIMGRYDKVCRCASAEYTGMLCTAI